MVTSWFETVGELRGETVVMDGWRNLTWGRISKTLVYSRAGAG